MSWRELAEGGLVEQVTLGGKPGYYAPRGCLSGSAWNLPGPAPSSDWPCGASDGPGRIEAGTLFGWRTAEGIWLADIGGEDKAERAILQVGPYIFMEFLTDLVTERSEEVPDDNFRMETSFFRDTLISRLRAVPEAVEAAPVEQVPPHVFLRRLRQFPGGGASLSATSVASRWEDRVRARPPAPVAKELVEGVKFCIACGTPVGGRIPHEASCIACGNPLEEVLAFCNKSASQYRGRSFNSIRQPFSFISIRHSPDTNQKAQLVSMRTS